MKLLHAFQLTLPPFRSYDELTICETERKLMAALEAFGEIVQPNISLAPFTHLRIGGPAEYLV